jgi:hypothetical protein
MLSICTAFYMPMRAYRVTTSYEVQFDTPDFGKELKFYPIWRDFTCEINRGTMPIHWYAYFIDYKLYITFVIISLIILILLLIALNHRNNNKTIPKEE